MTDLAPMKSALRLVGEDPGRALGPESAHLVAYGHDLFSQAEVPGLSMQVASGIGGIRARIEVEPGARIPRSVHLCFGLFQRHGTQDIDLELRMGPSDLLVALLVYASRERPPQHARSGRYRRGREPHLPGGSLPRYLRGIEVTPRGVIRLGPRARFLADFSLGQGRVGRLDIDYQVDVGAGAVAELTSKVFGHGSDHIRIREVVRLNGERAHGLSVPGLRPTARPSPRCWALPKATPPMPAATWTASRWYASGRR